MRPAFNERAQPTILPLYKLRIVLFCFFASFVPYQHCRLIYSTLNRSEWSTESSSVIGRSGECQKRSPSTIWRQVVLPSPMKDGKAFLLVRNVTFPLAVGSRDHTTCQRHFAQVHAFMTASKISAITAFLHILNKEIWRIQFDGTFSTTHLPFFSTPPWSPNPARSADAKASPTSQPFFIWDRCELEDLLITHEACQWLAKPRGANCMRVSVAGNGWTGEVCSYFSQTINSRHLALGGTEFPPSLVHPPSPFLPLT